MAKIFAGSLAVVLWAAAATAEVAPEAPPPEPLPISFSDIAERAATEVAALRAAETLLDRAPSLDQIEALLTEREAGVARRLVQLQRSLRMAASLDAIGEIEGEWQDTDRQLQAWADRLQGQSAVVEQELQRLDAGLAIWQATLREARAGAAPAEILGLTEATLESIEEARTGLKRLSDRTLGLLGRVGRARDAAAQALARVEDEKGAFVAQLATRDRAPLWSETVRGTSPRELASAARTELAAQAAALAVVWRQERDRVVFQLMVLLVLGLALRGARGESDADAPERREPGLLDQPFSLAALLTLLSTPWLYVSTPAALDDLVEVLLVVPVLRLLFPLVGRPLESALLALAGLYLADQLRDLVEAAPLLSRLLFLLEILAALALGGWLLHALPRQDAGQRRMAKVRLSTAAGVLRFALLLLGVAGLAAVAGFVRLGVLLGGGVLRSAYLAVLLVALARAGEATLKMVLRGRALRRLKVLEGRRRPLEKRARQGLRFVLGVSWAVATLELFALRDPILEIARVILFTELEAGAISLSLSDVLAFVATVLAAVLLARAVTLALEEDVYPRLRLGRGVPYAISTITRYGIILMGFVLAVGAMGLGMDRITVLLGAFGVGLGFGLQNVVNNFVSGLILIFERPVQVGDSVEAGSVKGNITRIGIRSSTVRTFDGADVTLPNGTLLSEALTNWTMSDRVRRIEVPVGVAYGTDPDRVVEALHAAVEGQEGLVASPAPQVLFLGFGDSSLDFVLRAWVEDNDLWVTVQSALALTVGRRLAERDIEIPFPQRDLHLRSVAPEARGLRSGDPPDSQE